MNDEIRSRTSSESRVATIDDDRPEVLGEEPGDAAVTASPWAGRAADLARWALFIGLTALALRRILITAVGADDLYVLPYQYRVGGSSFFTALRIGWDGASLGHFNYVGQIVGAVTGWAWVQLSLHLGIRYSLVFATTKYIVYLLTILAAAGFVRQAGELVGVQLSRWRCRTVVGVVLVATLQLHMGWSNDPTAWYPMSGFASAAVGFWLLSWAIRVYRDPSPLRLGLLGVGALGAVLFYELNVAAVVAVVPFLLYAACTGTLPLRDRVVRSLPLLVPVMLPAVATVVIRMFTQAAPGEEYGGTTVTGSGALIPTFLRAMVSSLPGAAWKLSRDWLAARVWIAPAQLLVLAILLTALSVAWVRSPLRPLGIDLKAARWKALAVVAAVGVYWAGATATQAATPKVQNESPGIGYVYNYYAIGAVAVAVLLSLLVLVVVPRLPRRALVVVAPTVGLLISAQFIINWNLSVRFNEITVPQQQIFVAYADELPESERCDAIKTWAGGGLPEYYRNGVAGGLMEAYQAYHGVPYCSSYPMPPPPEGTPDGS